MPKKDGGAAFARPATAFATPKGMSGDSANPGMPLRDWFAGMAMSGYLADHLHPHSKAGIATTVKMAYQMADAMLAERENTE